MTTSTPYELLTAELSNINYDNLAIEEQMELDGILSTVIEDVRAFSLEESEAEEEFFEALEGAISSVPVSISL